jgi:8-oxo-dGTP diphosphatase
MVTAATLCFVFRGEEVLLIFKAKGRFGGGKWNGLGGKLIPGETSLECVKREVKEESGLEVIDPRLRGTLSFRFGDDPGKDWFVHVYCADRFDGEPRPSDEGELKWFAIRDIPYEQMWEDDRHWLPLVLDGGDVRGDFEFDEEGTRLLSYDVEET